MTREDKIIHEILMNAIKAGEKALKECNPNPVVFQSSDLQGNQIGPSHLEEEGNCGGAYLTGIKFRSELYNFFKRNSEKEGIGANAKYKLGEITLRKGVYKGYTLHLPVTNVYNGQSHERKKAYYDAVAEVLRDEGFSCRVKDYLT